MKINAAIIGMGIGQKHFEAIEGYKNSKVAIICEKDKKKILQLKKNIQIKKLYLMKIKYLKIRKLI